MLMVLLAAVALLASGCAHNHYGYGPPYHHGHGPSFYPHSWYGVPGC